VRDRGTESKTDASAIGLSRSETPGGKPEWNPWSGNERLWAALEEARRRVMAIPSLPNGGCSPERSLRVGLPILLEVKPPTGEPDAGDPHVRFGGGRGRESNRLFLPLSNRRFSAAGYTVSFSRRFGAPLGNRRVVTGAGAADVAETGRRRVEASKPLEQFIDRRHQGPKERHEA